MQSDRHAYDNIIVGAVKGQTAAHVLFYVLSGLTDGLSIAAGLC